MGIDVNGTLWVWGGNTRGQISGTGNSTSPKHIYSLLRNWLVINELKLVQNSIDINYTTLNIDNDLNSIVLSGTGIPVDINLDLSTGSHNVNIPNIETGTEYSWNIEGTYEYNGNVKTFKIDYPPFLIKSPPEVYNVSISDIKATSVKLNYSINDDDSTIESIVLSGTGIPSPINLNFTPGEHNILIENLDPSTAYTDWVIEGIYDIGTGNSWFLYN